MVLKVKWIDFKSQIDKYIIEGEVLLEKYKSSRSEEEFTELKDAKQSWENTVISFVKKSFEPEHINFAYEFRAQKGYNLGMKLGVDQKIKNTIQALKDEINGLNYYLKILFISDAIVRPDEIDLNERQNLDTDGILDLILSKLYDLYKDGKYHSLNLILEGNGVKLNGRSEDWDYGRMLENRGFIECMNGRNVNAKLKLEGKYAIEQARKRQVTDYSKISSSDEELKELIKQVLSEIEKLGYGQQIIFDEFDELREDIPNLDKKSFGQLLKAKLYDLVTQEAFDKAIASEIFKQFTDQILPF
ncbi:MULTISPECIES: hypothetical protein [Flavobacteriaceae]|uniref:Uncharacterized protein n=2 Tax=Flavobacteriaceae TaxID=49546 RepID=A3XIV1_LEEBM|nr:MULTISPECIES: hypothetical protein [Flavobacteriaceae]ADF52156.1 conserved hypothetical protein [Zunongwangia profunda SM-A87]EAQ50522.1 hypothetical protein MED217_05802 [Leeuwenhoekiella blandensis MED217]